MKLMMRCSLAFVIFSGAVALAQNQSQTQTSPRWRPFGEIETELLEPAIKEPRLPKYLEEFTSLEIPVDPDSYILGPGDLLGISIITGENSTLFLRIGPTGDLLIPAVGIVKVAGLTLASAATVIREYVTEQVYRNSKVDVTLVDVRTFKILAVGAVREPGFVTVASTDRLTEAIAEAGGLHKYANEEKIKVVRSNGSTERVSLKSFLLDGDLVNNPTFQEGDRIEVPFKETYRGGAEETMTFNESAILVTGFVTRPGAYRYFPGYTVRDYIGMAGGVDETGSIRKVDVFRSNREVEIGLNDFVAPGDTINIRQNLRYLLFGRTSVFQLVAASVALLVTYQRLLEIIAAS